MKNKKLTPLQKTIQTQRAVKKYLKEVIEPKMMLEIKNSFDDKKLPFECFKTEDTEIKNFIINKYLKN